MEHKEFQQTNQLRIELLNRHKRAKTITALNIRKLYFYFVYFKLYLYFVYFKLYVYFEWSPQSL